MARKIEEVADLFYPDPIYLRLMTAVALTAIQPDPGVGIASAHCIVKYPTRLMI